MHNFFQITKPREFWGDYGNTLRHGWCSPNKNGPGIVVQRTGPFVPPISFPSFGPELRIVVTEEFRNQLNAAGFSGCEFNCVTLEKIVESDWQKWDRPILRRLYKPYKKCIENGEPGELIENSPHSDEVKMSMPNLYHLDAKPNCKFTHKMGVGYFLVAGSWQGNDLFKHPKAPWYFVSQRFRKWLKQSVPNRIGFKDVRVESDA